MLTRVMYEIGSDIAKLVREIMDSNVGMNMKVGKNTLSDSDLYRELSVRSTSDGDLVFDIMLNDYITYIENGRRKGAKFPPIEPIIQWCRKKGLPTDNSTIFLIRRAISRDGIAARPIMARVFDELYRNWNDGWADHIFNKIMEHIDKFFA